MSNIGTKNYAALQKKIKQPPRVKVTTSSIKTIKCANEVTFSNNEERHIMTLKARLKTFRCKHST